MALSVALWLSFGLTHAWERNEASCHLLTDGTCHFFGCDAIRNAECVDGHCQCPDQFCAEYIDPSFSGSVCVAETVTQTTTTPAPVTIPPVSHDQCKQAYFLRCFEQAEYIYTCPANVGSCNTGSSQFTCNWQYTENSPYVSIGASFDASTEQCRDACTVLNNPDNNRFAYCHAQRTVGGCEDAVTSINSVVADDFCHSEGRSHFHCSWWVDRGTVGDDKCPDKKYVRYAKEFDYEVDGPKTEPCRLACQKLGDPTNIFPLDPADQAIIDACGVPVPAGMNGTIAAELTCSWSFNFGQDTISGSFGVPFNNAACSTACQSLTGHNLHPAELCPGGAVRLRVENCDPALQSLNDAHVPEQWCSTPTSLIELPETSMSSSLVTTHLDTNTDAVPVSAAVSPAFLSGEHSGLCEAAYRNACWNEPGFKDCCGDCQADSGSNTCNWSYRGPPTYSDDGKTCKNPGDELSGSFTYDSAECFTACGILSNRMKENGDFCPGTSLRQDIDTKCPAATQSVNDALNAAGLTAEWCGAAALELNAVSLVASDLCNQAYEARCFEQPPFSRCCAVCSNASSTASCHWSYEESEPIANPISVSGDYTYDLADGNCRRACAAFGAAGRTRPDYCPGGGLREAANACPAAAGSLQAEFNDDYCQKTVSGKVQCTWQYSYASVSKDSNGKFDHPLNGTIQGSFAYDHPDENCHKACNALSWENNLPSMYCEGTDVMDVVNACGPAASSFQSASVPAPWCDADQSVVMVPQHTIDWMDPESQFRASEVAGDLCQQAYANAAYHGCLSGDAPGQKAFDQCCNTWSNAQIFQECHWSFSIPNGPDGDLTINGNFRYYDEVECFHACNVLRGITTPADLCLSHEEGQGRVRMNEWVQKCPPTGGAHSAPASITTAMTAAGVHETWCPNDATFEATDAEKSRYGGKIDAPFFLATGPSKSYMAMAAFMIAGAICGLLFVRRTGSAPAENQEPLIA